jgi:hypothetical protein
MSNISLCVYAYNCSGSNTGYYSHYMRYNNSYQGYQTNSGYGGYSGMVQTWNIHNYR